MKNFMSNEPELKRSLSLVTMTFYGVGAILGAGIYVLVGEVAAAAGYFAPLSFLLACVIALFSAFTYADLTCRFPRSAGEALYIEEAFHRRRLTQLIGLMVVATGIVSAATMATGVVGYVQLYLDVSSASIIIAFILLIGAVAIWGIKESAWLIMLITLVEVGGLFYVVSVAADAMPLPSVMFERGGSVGDSLSINGLFLGAFLAFYAYIGFEDMVNVAEEVNRPARVLPLAIFLALTVSSILYVLVSYAALSVLTPEQLAISTAPLADVVAAKGYAAEWISIISLIAVINGAIVQLIMASRVIYGMARKQLLPVGLARVNACTATPIIATLCCVAAILLLALLFPLASLAQATSLVVLAIFTLVNMALIRLNRMGAAAGRFRCWPWIPYVGFLLSVSMLLFKFFSWL